MENDRRDSLKITTVGATGLAPSVAGAEDHAARERLVCYVLRPRLAHERLTS